MKPIKYFILTFILISTLSFCNKQKKDAESALLEEFLASQDTVISVDGKDIYIIPTGFSTPETTQNIGPGTGDTIVSIFKGYLLADYVGYMQTDPSKIIDEADITNPQKYAYLEDNVIVGWQIAMGEMRKDQSALIVIHSDYAYKVDQVGLIPPFSTLIYEVRILDIIE